jgi:hypothetical protein
MVRRRLTTEVIGQVIGRYSASEPIGVRSRFRSMIARLLALVCCAALFIGATPRHSRNSPPQTLTAQAIEQMTS